VAVSVDNDGAALVAAEGDFVTGGGDPMKVLVISGREHWNFDASAAADSKVVVLGRSQLVNAWGRRMVAPGPNIFVPAFERSA